MLLLKNQESIFLCLS